MKIAVYTLCYNESFFLPFFLDHYLSFASKVVVYDNMSTDGSLDVCLRRGANVALFDSKNEVREDLQTEIRNSCWKEDKSVDWAMVVDMDELVYHENLLPYLSRMKEEGFTVLAPKGYQMVSSVLPNRNKPLLSQMRRGFASKKYSKPIIFDPNRILETNFAPGSHSANMSGDVKRSSDDSLKLLHFHFLSPDYVIGRNKWRKERLSTENKENGWGHEYLKEDEEVRKLHKSYLKKSSDVFKRKKRRK